MRADRYFFLAVSSLNLVACNSSCDTKDSRSTLHKVQLPLCSTVPSAPLHLQSPHLARPSVEHEMQPRLSAEVQPRLRLPGGSNSTAVCIVGHPRTFSYPAVHRSILQVVRAWHAHTYFTFNVAGDVQTMSSITRHFTMYGLGLESCEVNMTAVMHFSPKAVRIVTDPICPESSGYTQLVLIDDCFRQAEHYAHVHHFNYSYFVRLRPDMMFAAIPQHPNFPLWDDRPRVHRTHSDLAFVLSAPGLASFRAHTPPALRGCVRGTSLEYCHPGLCYSNQSVVWRTASGLVRTKRKVHKSDNYLGSWQKVDLKDNSSEWLWQCNLTARIEAIPKQVKVPAHVRNLAVRFDEASSSASGSAPGAANKTANKTTTSNKSPRRSQCLGPKCFIDPYSLRTSKQ